MVSNYIYIYIIILAKNFFKYNMYLNFFFLLNQNKKIKG